jgi:hypothetical protein
MKEVTFAILIGVNMGRQRMPLTQRVYSADLPTGNANGFPPLEIEGPGRRSGNDEIRRNAMREILLAMLVAAGIGLVGTAGVSAAPASGTAILDAVAVTDPVTQAQWWHGPRRSHWRWGSRGFVHGPYRSHWRWGSRGGRCHIRFRSRWVRC